MFKNKNHQSDPNTSSTSRSDGSRHTVTDNFVLKRAEPLHTSLPSISSWDPDTPTSTTTKMKPSRLFTIREPIDTSTNTDTKMKSKSKSKDNKDTSMPKPKRTDTSTTVKEGGTSRRPPLARVPSQPTRYMEMLLHLDEIPRMYNILSSLGTWIILAGFLVVPGTFTTFKESKAFRDADSDNDDNNQVAHAIAHSIANIGLLWLSGSFCVVGTVLCLWLWWLWRYNYVWLVNKIFMYVSLPGVFPSSSSLVSCFSDRNSQVLLGQ